MGDLRRVVFPLLLILLVLAVIGWFRRTYARNLSHLLSTVALSLASSPKRWLAQAIALADADWNGLAWEPAYSHWQQARPQSYGFGHSLGGLLSLSLPWAFRDAPGSRFQPRVIVVAGPAADSEMGIPGFAIGLLKLFGAPFTADPLRIRDTGAQLTQPVAILHGAADGLVPPSQWVGTNEALDPALIAFPNQAVTSTQYDDDALFRSFGGVKDGPNAYDTAFIWPAALALYGETVQPSDLLEVLPEHPFTITTGEPP